MANPDSADKTAINTGQIQTVLDEVYRQQSRRIFATLIRMLGDFDLAEEALHDAFAAAVEKWPRDGVPGNPAAWLVSTGRFKAIDTLRRRKRFEKTLSEQAEFRQEQTCQLEDIDQASFNDDHLRLIFTCCHPALSADARIALTLRETCGLTTEEIASAYLTTPSTIAQRIVRAKAKIRDAGIPYEVPTPTDLPERLSSVLSVIYLVFNEGYYASSGTNATRPDLSSQAIHLGRVLLELSPQPEVMGLLALMLLHESRRQARTSQSGDLVLLENQDRTIWNQRLISEGKELLQMSMATGSYGPYTLQAAISAVHAEAKSAAQTDWRKIISIYDQLLHFEPSPVVELNRAVAVAMADGPQAGLSLVEAILETGQLDDYHLVHAARADLCRRLGRKAEARQSYNQALNLAQQEPEKRFLEKRLRELD